MWVTAIRSLNPTQDPTQREIFVMIHLAPIHLHVAGFGCGPRSSHASNFRGQTTGLLHWLAAAAGVGGLQDAQKR
jgi:hypothetical protein